jgi:TolA-binding protein
VVADPRAAFEAAAALESSDPAAALRAYRALARGTGPWSANALYAAARLALDGGDRALARRLARAYLDRFPRGGNAADAAALLSRTQGAPE